MKNTTFCAICQKPCHQIVCDCCEQQWGHTAAWIHDLRILEQRNRDMLRDDEQAVAFHIDAIGHIRVHADPPSPAHSIRKAALQVSDFLAESDIQAIQMWATSGGLTAAECHAFELMSAGLTGPQAAVVINEVEHKHITAKAYHRRLEMAIKKIRRAFVNNLDWQT